MGPEIRGFPEAKTYHFAAWMHPYRVWPCGSSGQEHVLGSVNVNAVAAPLELCVLFKEQHKRLKRVRDLAGM